MKPIEAIMRTAPVIPVLVIDDVGHALPVARALVAGGLRVLEVTLRTPAALEAITAMKSVEGAIVGAGTVTNPDELKAAIDAGAEFIVSPGLTDRLGQAAVDAGIPFLPGTACAADIMRGLDLGLTHFKFFPASTSGGLPALKALAAPFYQARFCPTGGISALSPKKTEDYHQAVNTLFQMLQSGLRSHTILTRKAFENAITVVFASLI